MSLISWIVLLIFLPASLGLIQQSIFTGVLSHQLLALVLVLMSLEQARMAVIDLEQIRTVQQRSPVQDARLNHFYRITVSTIILELIGFYLGSMVPALLGWAALLTSLSQFWFNLFAKIQLQPDQEVPIQAWGITQRLPVLLANTIGTVLVLLWMLQIVPLYAVSLLLGLVILYMIAKYFLLSGSDKPSSPVKP